MILNIEAVYLLFVFEISLVLLVASLYFLAGKRKFRKLYRAALKELESVQARDDGGTAQRAEAESSEPSQQGTLGEIPAAETRAAVPLEKEIEEMLSEEEQSDGYLAGKVQKLERIVDLQKSKILDLMCYKDIFEGAQRKLDAIRTNYQELQVKINSVVQSPGENEELAGLTNILESSNRDLESYIGILSKENESLAEKFAAWENEIKIIWGETGAPSEPEGSVSVDENRYAEIMREKDDLMAKVGEFEGKLAQKNALLEELQKQYEDMEKEYMILYNKQMTEGQPAV